MNYRLDIQALRFLAVVSVVLFHTTNSLPLGYQGGTCLLFDTNIEHRGGYSESRGVRHCIVVEFIDREKAEKIKQFSPCGPLQGKGRIRISGKPELIEKSDLLDKSILNKVRDDLFEYG